MRVVKTYNKPLNPFSNARILDFVCTDMQIIPRNMLNDDMRKLCEIYAKGIVDDFSQATTLVRIVGGSIGSSEWLVTYTKEVGYKGGDVYLVKWRFDMHPDKLMEDM